MPEVEVEVLALASEVEAPVLVVVAEELRPPVGPREWYPRSG